MDNRWMLAPRYTDEYEQGLNKFIELAFANSAKGNKILCPCKNCRNTYWLGEQVVRDHLLTDTGQNMDRGEETNKGCKVSYETMRANRIRSNNAALKALHLPLISSGYGIRDDGADSSHPPTKSKKAALLCHGPNLDAPAPPLHYEDGLENELDDEYVGDNGEETSDDEGDDSPSEIDEENIEHMDDVLGNKRKARGPTKIKPIWEGRGKVKINVKFNRYGQLCGVKTSKLTNFIATLVKGRELTLMEQNWSKVSSDDKEKFWKMVEVTSFRIFYCSLGLSKCNMV